MQDVTANPQFAGCYTRRMILLFIWISLSGSNPDPIFLEKLFGVLKSRKQQIQSLGREYLENELFYKNRFDFRLDTGLNLFERYGVTSGSLEQKNLTIIKEELPSVLLDQEKHETKLIEDQKKLLGIVQYFRASSCRRQAIETYFGFPDEPACGNCDVCDGSSTSSFQEGRG